MAGESKSAGLGERVWLKRFLLRLAMFALFYIAFRSIMEAVVPYHVGNDVFERKLDMLEEERLTPETLFIGTSRVQYQVDPLYFDSVVALSRTDPGVSYNFGVYSSKMLESIHLTKGLLKSKAAARCRTVFMELYINTNLNEIENKGKERGFYWLDPSDYIIMAKGILSQNGLNPWEKLDHLGSLTLLTISRYLGLDRIRSYVMKEDNKFLRSVQSERRGYISLDEMEASFPWEREGLSKARRGFDSSRTRDFTKSMELQQMQTPDPQSPAWSESLNGFIEEASRSGVRVVYVSLPPFRDRLDSYVSGGIKPGHYLNMANPLAYPELFDPSLYFDNIHLNRKGGRLLTRLLAEAALDLDGTSGESFMPGAQTDPKME